MTGVSWEPGTALPLREYAVTRADLVRYAGASGDRNPIHWSDRVASSVGLPGVIAHGMYTMALAARAVESWAGGPERVRERHRVGRGQRVSRCGWWQRQRGQNFLSSRRSGSLRRFFLVM